LFVYVSMRMISPCITRRTKSWETPDAVATVRPIVCPQCATVNRVVAERDAGKARCGSCKAPLFDGHPVEVDTVMFDKQTGRSSVPVLVDVWAPWCGSCRLMTPAFEAAARLLEPYLRLVMLS